MEKFVKIKRPFKVYDARLVDINGKTYAEAMVTNSKGTSIVAVCTQSATALLRDYIANISDFAHDAYIDSFNTHVAVDLHSYGLVAWLTVNEKGHTISFIRKEA